jgi:PAS domain S-box-containing protein
MPVILLSARAGEESRSLGMDAGADDYLVKPFSARELLARVGAHLRLARARKEAEHKLRTVDERLRQAISIDTVGVIFFDLDGAILDANDAFLRMSGYTREDLARGVVRWDRLTPPEFMHLARKAIEEFRTQGRNTPYEKQYLRPDGTRWWGLFAGRQVDENEFVEFVIDITARKQAEEALEEHQAWLSGQREALEVALNGAPLETSLGLLIRTAAERLGPGVRAAFYAANPEGTTLHHVVGMTAEYADAVDGFQIGAGSLACGLATYSGTPVLTADVAEEPLWKPWRWLAEKFGYRGCWSFPMHNAAGMFLGTFAVYSERPREAGLRDVEFGELVARTASIIVARHVEAEERRRAEMALRDHRARLEQDVASRTAELEVRVAERDALLKEVHHRVKNNLQVISSLLEMQATRADDPQVFRQLEDACNRVLSIASIHELIYRGGTFAAVSLGDYARDLASRLIAFHGIGDRVQVGLFDEGIVIDLERAVSCGLVLNELISNSCKHAFPPGKSGEIAIRLSHAGENIRLEVADTGPGFTLPVDRPGKGSLGLSLVRALVGRNLAGTVGIRFENGTRVEIEFPERLEESQARNWSATH